MFLGFVLTSYMIAFWSHGIKKCVPSLTTVSCTPERRSKMTARVPPLTSYIADWANEAPMKSGTAYFEIALRMFGAAMMIADVEMASWERWNGWWWSQGTAWWWIWIYFDMSIYSCGAIACSEPIDPTSLELPLNIYTRWFSRGDTRPWIDRPDHIWYIFVDRIALFILQRSLYLTLIFSSWGSTPWATICARGSLLKDMICEVWYVPYQWLDFMPWTCWFTYPISWWRCRKSMNMYLKALPIPSIKSQTDTISKTATIASPTPVYVLVLRTTWFSRAFGRLQTLYGPIGYAHMWRIATNAISTQRHVAGRATRMSFSSSLSVTRTTS